MRTSLSVSDPRPCAPRFTRLESRRSCAARLTDRRLRPPCSPDPRSSGSSPAIASAGLSRAMTSPRHTASIAATVVGFGTGAPKSSPPPALGCSSTMHHRASSAIEGFNAALRPYLYVHKGVTQGFLDLFRAWFNLRTRRWGRHKRTSPHQCLTGQRVGDWFTLLGYPHGTHLVALFGASLRSLSTGSVLTTTWMVTKPFCSESGSRSI